MKVSHYSVKHPAVIAMVLIALVAFGFYCIAGLNVEFVGDMSLPSVMVIAVYPGASAEDVERDVTRILENDFVTLSGFKSITSVNQNSFTWITIEFADGVDPDEAIIEVRYHINQLMADLPEGLQGEPYAMVGSASMLPVYSFSIEGGEDIGAITRYVNDSVVPLLTKIDGVSAVDVTGGSDLQVQVKLRLDDLQSKGISVLQVYQMLSYSNIYIPLGEGIYNGKNVTLNFDGRFSTLSDLENLTVGAGDDNTLIKLGDVADVSYAYPKTAAKAFSDGEQIVIIDIQKTDGGNTMQIAKAVKKVIKQIEAEGGGAFKVTTLAEDSRTVRTSLRTVVESGILGLVMAVIVIYLYLSDFRATFIIAFSIPLSILFTFLGMKVLGLTINLITVSGLVVALGMIVDGSIVMLEQVYRHFHAGSLPVDECIFIGSDEVGGSILASGITTIVVFVPIIFLKGIVGMIVSDFAVTMIICMSASIFVAIIVVPFFMNLFFGKKRPALKKDTPFMKLHRGVEKGYRKGLSWALDNRFFIILIPVVLLVLSLLLFGLIGYTFIPSVDNGDFYVNLEFPTGYTPERTEAKMLLAEEIVRREVPEIDTLGTFSCTTTSIGYAGGSDAQRQGYIHVVLCSSEDRDRKIQSIINSLQRTLSSEIPDATVKVENGGFDKLIGYVSGGGGFQYSLVGTDLDSMYGYAVGLRDYLRTVNSVVTAEIDTSFDAISVDIKAASDYMNSLGLTAYEAGITSRILFSGIETGNVTGADGQRYSVNLLSDASDLPLSEDLLSKLTVQSAAGSFVSFSGLADLTVENTINRINHENRLRSITVSATLVSEDASEVNGAVSDYIAAHPLPSGVESQEGGIMGLITDSLGSVASALVIAIFLVYMVMVIQFERFRQPFFILLSIPFAIIGVVLGLLVFGTALNLMSVVAIISLCGIVVNNAIILVEYINLLRNRKRAAVMGGVAEELVDTSLCSVKSSDAFNKYLDLETELSILQSSVVDGGSSRLRPIMMTTLTTLFGVFPMALALGEGAELYAPVGQAIFGGLFASTLITLVLIPVVYYIFERRALKAKAAAHKIALSGGPSNE